MRILHVTPCFYPAVLWGGPVSSLLGLCDALARQGVELKVLTTDTGCEKERLTSFLKSEVEARGYPVYFCHRRFRTSVAPALLGRLIQLVRWADLVHLTAVYSFPTIPTLLTCKMLDRPVVWTPRGALQRWRGTTKSRRKAIWEQVCRVVAPRRLAFHVTSAREGEESEERFPGLRTVVIPHGIQFPEKLPERDRDAREFFHLLYLGRLHPIKGIENLLYGLDRLNGTLNRPWCLTLAGRGEKRYTGLIKNLVARLGFAGAVQVIGEVTGNEKERLFEKSDVVVVPSHTENFGMVVGEALAHGVPVIASKGTPWQRIEEIGCGLWVENDPASLADAISQMSRLPLREMGERGREWMKREFSWEDRARKMTKLYSRLIDS